MKTKRIVKVAETRLHSFFDNLTIDLLSCPTANSPREFAVKRLLSRMRKRAELDNPALHTKALSDFKNLNDSLSGFEIQENPLFDHAADFIRYVLTKFIKRKYPDSLQECFSLNYILDNWRFGPGASNGIKGTGTVEKIDIPMTFTSRAEPFVKLIRSESVYFRAYDGLPERAGCDVSRLVNGSRLTTVLKNETAVRTIAIEASGNMAVQLSAGRLIEEVLAMIGFDIRSQQPKNQSLARRGSSDGTVCTIDLKSASDMETPSLIRKVWPPEWYAFFMKVRSPQTEIPGIGTVDLNMISTMGNGFTFPMMTLTLLSLVYANRLANFDGPYRFIDRSSTGVFGDDIIVPNHEYSTLCALLSDAGFVVNSDKSYSTGSFRESCGGDYYEGVDVTPFYVKSLSQPSDIYVAINQVLRWSGRHSLPLTRSLKYLFGLLRSKIFFVPEWCDDASGVRLAQCPKKYKLLQPKQVKRPYKGHFAMPLCCGGFLSQDRDGTLEYNPRSSWVNYRVGTAKLPDGYLDGWDPRYGTYSQSNYRSLLVSIVT